MILANLPPHQKLSFICKLPPCPSRLAEGGIRLQKQVARRFESSEPLVSVITIVLNGEKHLEQTIKSAITQNYSNIEYIIIDGGSSDHSLDIIRCYEEYVEYWVSEQDKGIANAMNKGIQVSRGDYIIFLHADDYFLNEHVIEKAISHLGNGCDIAAFNIIFQKRSKEIECKPRGFNYWLNFKTGLYHQGVFCSKAFFKKLGGFDESYKVAMDYELWLRAYRNGITPKIFDYPIACMRDTGISSKRDWLSMKERFFEERRVHFQHVPNNVMRVIYKIYWLLYIPYRYVRFVYE